MNWLAQNWLWILLLLGVLVVLSRGGHRGRRNQGYHGHGGYAGPGGFGHEGHGAPDDGTERSQHPGQSALAIDPVTRKDVSTASALTSIHRGRIYYFETAESRQRFETSPEQYAREGLGHSLGPAGRAMESRRARRRGGC